MLDICNYFKKVGDSMKKTFLAVVLVLCMALNLLPLEAMAADAADDYTPPVVSHLYYVSDPGTSQEQKTQILNPSSPLNIVPTASFAFEVQFMNPEYVDKVYITSTVNGVVSYLEAQVNQAHNLWKTSGLFNEDADYVPGTIGVEFTTHHGVITVTNTWNPVWDSLKLSGIVIDNEQETEGTTSFDVLLSGLTGFSDESLSATISESNGIGNATSEVKGWLEDLDSLVHFEFEDPEKGTDYIVYLGYPAVESQNCALIVEEVTGNKFTTMLIKKANGDLDAVADQLSTINTISSLYSDYYKISAESASLKEQIAASPTMNAQDKITANQKVDNLDKDKKLFALFTTVLPLISGTAAGPAGLLFSALLSSITATSDYFWDYRLGLIEGCDPIENIFSESGDHPGWTELTGRTIQESGIYFLSNNLGSLTIKENAKVTLCLHGHTISGITMNNGSTLQICDCKYAEHDDGSVIGGMISRTISMKGQNELTLEQGIIQGNYGHAIVSEGSNGKITVNGGMIEGVNGAIIADDGGNSEITINNGTLKSSGSMGTGIRVNDGSHLTINDGVITISGYIVTTYDPNGNSDATIQINGGTLTGKFRTNVGRITIDMEQGSITGDIFQVGTVLFKKGICTGTVSGNNVTITDGTVGHVYGANITIDGGVVSGGMDCSSYGADATRTTAVINGGTIYGDSSNGIGIQNYRSSRLTINGGTIYGGITNTETAQLTITNGTIYGGIINNNSSDTSLLVQNSTNIQVSGTQAFSKAPTISADTGYVGGITYYSSAGSQGTPMTIEEAATANYTGSYVRLVASGAVSGNDKVTVTPSTGGNVTFTPSEPADGDTVTITVTPDSGYQGGTPVVKDSSGNTIPVTDAGNGKYTFTKPAGQVTITAPEFTRPTYSVTAPVSTPNGSVTVSAATVHEGDTVTITITPNAGYQGGVPVVKDADGNTLTITDAGNGKYTFVMPAKNVVVTAAEFTPMSYTITNPSKPSNGTVSLSAATAHKGDTVTITVTPDVNFTANPPVVTGAGGNVAVTKVSDTTYTFVMPEGNVTVTASFSVINFTLAYTPYASMTDADKKLYYGGKLEITGLVPNTKYVVTFDNGLAAPKQVNGRNVIPRIAHVVTSDAAGKVALGCQDSMNVMVFGVSSGGNVTTDLVELYAKNHAGVPVSGLASKGSGT